MAKIYGFNIVLMPYNVFHLSDLLDWFATLKNMNYEFETFYELSEGYNTEMSSVLPNHMKSAIKSLQDWSQKNNYDISDILSLLDSVKFDEKAFDYFKEYNNKLDGIRKTSFVNLDKRFVEYVVQHEKNT